MVFLSTSVMSVVSLGVLLSEPVVTCSGPESVIRKFVAELWHELSDHKQVMNFSEPQFPPFTCIRDTIIELLCEALSSVYGI